MNWLLSAQALAQLIASVQTPAAQWAAGIDTRGLRVSVISIAQVRMTIQARLTPSVRARWEADLDTALAHIESDSGVPPLPFTAEHARLWADLCLDTTIPTVAQIDRQVYATAMYEGLTIVEPSKPEHAVITALGVRVHAL